MIDEHYDIILKRVVTVFEELESIVLDIRNNIEAEQKQDPRLSIEITSDALRIVKSAKESFKSYRSKSNKHWSIEKYVDYVQQKLSSFYREFDNPFLGSNRWYQRIVQLQDRLTQESRELERLMELQKGDS